MNTKVFQMNTEVFQVNTEVLLLKYGRPHTPDSSVILKYSHPSGLFSGAAVNARGAVWRKLTQRGCERSSIVIWATGQRVGVSEPSLGALVQYSDCYARSIFEREIKHREVNLG